MISKLCAVITRFMRVISCKDEWIARTSRAMTKTALSDDVVDQGAFDFLDHVFEPELFLFELLHMQKVDRLRAAHRGFDRVIERFMLSLVFCEF